MTNSATMEGREHDKTDAIRTVAVHSYGRMYSLIEIKDSGGKVLTCVKVPSADLSAAVYNATNGQ